MKTVLAILCFCSLALGTNHYICSTASGSHNGTEWTDAWTTLSQATWTRGDLYYFGCSNSFTSPTLSTSGTSTIEWRSATIADHGTATGWSNGMQAQTVFTGRLTLSGGIGNWIFNGNGVRGSDWQSGYLMKFYNPTGGGNGAFDCTASGCPNVTLEYVEVQGSGTTFTGSLSDEGVFAMTQTAYIGYSYVHDAGCDLVSVFRPTSLTAEYNMFARNNNEGANGQHCQALGIGEIPTLIVRYNYFRDITNTGLIDDDNSNGSSFTPAWYVYGNTIYWTTSVCTIAGCGLSTDSGIGLFGGETFSGGVIQIYNNNVAGFNTAYCRAGTGICTEVMLEQTNNPAPTGTMPTVTIYNTLFWNPCTAGESSIQYSGLASNTTGDYSEVYCPIGGCSTNVNCSGSQIGGSHGVLSNTGSPFVNFDGSSNFNFGLSANTPAGLSIAGWSSAPSGCTSGTNCEDSDPLGIVRGANGTVDRGAFQIAAAATNGGAISGAGSMAGTGSVQ